MRRRLAAALALPFLIVGVTACGEEDDETVYVEEDDEGDEEEDDD